MPEAERKDTYGSVGSEPATPQEWANYLAEQLEKTVRERPLLSIAVAAVAGFFLASLRRR
jgi:ElaB/YqjD/DUF883 family membrane-anchored ribosome-binding protein